MRWEGGINFRQVEGEEVRSLNSFSSEEPAYFSDSRTYKKIGSPPETYFPPFLTEHVGKIWKAYAEGGGGGWKKREEDQVVLMWHPSLLSYSNNQTALFLEALSSPLCRWLQEVAKEEEEIDRRLCSRRSKGSFCPFSI